VKHFAFFDSSAVNPCCCSAVAIAAQEEAITIMANTTSEQARIEPHRFQGLESVISL